MLEYATDLFDARPSSGWPRGWCGCWRRSSRTRTARSAALDALDAAERHSILRDWNDTARRCRRRDAAASCSRRRSRRTPDAVAVVFEDEQPDLRASSTRASNRLAHHLRALGVGPEAVVGLCMERSLEMVVGAARHPQGRAAPICRSIRTIRPSGSRSCWRMRGAPRAADAVGAAASGCRRHRRPRRAASMPTGPRDRSASRQHRAGHGARPAEPAYVIYTSGSTGTPKGVAVTHGGMVRLISRGPDRSLRITAAATRPAVRIARASTPSLWEMCGALLHGARLRPGADRDRRALRRTLARLDSRAGRHACDLVPPVLLADLPAERCRRRDADRRPARRCVADVRRRAGRRAGG